VTVTYDLSGNTHGTTVNGVSSSASISSTTNYAAPDQITVGSSLTTSMSYSSFLGLTSETGPNGTSVDIGYDTSGRPQSSTSPFGATTYTVYNDSASTPNTCTSVNTRWTETILDGLGRALKVLTGSYASSGQTTCSSASGATTLTETDTSYDSCGCSPMGKLASQTVPYTYGGSAGASTTYYYDGIGRTLAVTAGGSDTTGTSYYSYAANTAQATDPAGKWKNFTMDGFGNLYRVIEPDPTGGSNYVTYYTYDLLNHLTGVSMTRSTGTQTRSFVYNGNFLMSATNPENGTVSYTYSSGGKVATRTDAKGQQVVYSYDSYARLSEVQRYPTSGTEDVCQREVYYYDGSNPLSSSYPQNALGHLSAVQYWGGYDPNVSACDTTFTEMYTYSVAGAPVGKQLETTRTLQYSGMGWYPYSFDLAATFSYDNEGRLTGETYPTDHSIFQSSDDFETG
jgi:YD repeat-containing protein